MSDYDQIVNQNENFKTSRLNNDITDEQYREAIDFQNQNLQLLLNAGEITQSQYNAAIEAEKLSSTSSSSGITAVLSQTKAGVPLYVWLIIAVAAGIAIVAVVAAAKRSA